MAWEALFNIVASKLLLKCNTLPIMQACVPVIDANHHRIALKVIGGLIGAPFRDTHRILLHILSSGCLPRVLSLAHTVALLGLLFHSHDILWALERHPLRLLRTIFLRSPRMRIAAPTWQGVVGELHEPFEGSVLVTPVDDAMREMKNSLPFSFIQIHLLVFEE